jgi:hypothetical protein
MHLAALEAGTGTLRMRGLGMMGRSLHAWGEPWSAVMLRSAAGITLRKLRAPGAIVSARLGRLRMPMLAPRLGPLVSALARLRTPRAVAVRAMLTRLVGLRTTVAIAVGARILAPSSLVARSVRSREFILRDAPIAIAVELTERFSGFADLLRIEGAVPIRVEDAKEPRSRWRTITIRTAGGFARAGFRRTRGWIFLRVEDAGGEDEGGEYGEAISFHGSLGLEVTASRRCRGSPAQRRRPALLCSARIQRTTIAR